MQKLRVRYEEEEYQGMIASATPELASSFLEPFEKKELKQQVSVIINVLFSVFSVGFAAWYWASRMDTGKRLLLALFSGLIVLIAEVGLYMGYIQRLNDAKEEERRNPEIKEIRKQTEFSSKVI